MDGFLNLHKPAGFTSHDCVAKVRRLLKLKRVGHAGTLDPAATGVLPIALGRTTRLLQFLPQNKAYRATIRLGMSTTTDDLEGAILTRQPVPNLELETVQAALQPFQGTIQQVPPSYSAIQVQGQRLYDLARAGKELTVQPRSVTVHRITVLDWHSQDFPELEVEIACGPGTYIRAIARDLGQALQVGGTLAALVRTESSGFQLADSLTLEVLENQILQGEFQPVAPDIAVQHLPAIALPVAIAQRWCQGQQIVPPTLSILVSNNAFLRVHREDGCFLGIGQLMNLDAKTLLIPQMVFSSTTNSSLLS
ncbi:MAG: tRNA pseudouridine(55) synthase TruB [Leptolyngbyaceae cyanobacterium RU_5_1]|nr:tRNA pseudouridine(55) synthase TruB [Leptolyngbyaceae cyanobacterium RU_5_1]